MKVRFLVFQTIFLLMLTFVIYIGCDKDTTPSLWDPSKPSGPTPEISEMIPPVWALSGVSEIIIKGKNFSTNVLENFVYFNHN